mmetsp:Transcript_4313/g.10281  ORF Transcript_4313/g.10281 Transcript_4313/m.10281 type:complete len:219 (-) Transcript_4313:163-819(-)
MDASQRTNISNVIANIFNETLVAVVNNDLFNTLDKELSSFRRGLRFRFHIHHGLSGCPSILACKGTQDLHNVFVLLGAHFQGQTAVQDLEFQVWVCSRHQNITGMKIAVNEIMQEYHLQCHSQTNVCQQFLFFRWLVAFYVMDDGCALAEGFHQNFSGRQFVQRAWKGHLVVVCKILIEPLQMRSLDAQIELGYHDVSKLLNRVYQAEEFQIEAWQTF